MNKETLVRKITSRRFISMVVAVINGVVVMTTVGYSPESLTEVVTVTVSCIAYMVTETKVDASREASNTTNVTANTSAAETVKKIAGVE